MCESAFDKETTDRVPAQAPCPGQAVVVLFMFQVFAGFCVR